MEVGLVRKKKRNGLYLVQCLWLLGVFAHTARGNTPHFSQFSFKTEPSNVVAKVGQPATLNCSAIYHGDSTLEIHWRKNGVALQIDGQRRKKLPDGSLYFQKVVQSSDEGFYQCVGEVVNLGTIVSRTAHLQIAYLEQTFEKEPQDLTLYLTDTAMFACQIDGKPDTKTEWFKNNERVNEKYNIQIYPDGVLEISSVEISNIGQYMCRVTNSEGSRVSASATLNQEDKDVAQRPFDEPKFVMKPTDKRAVFGSTVYLHCGANGRDFMSQPPEITWLKDGRSITFRSATDRVRKIGVGTLMIKSVIESDKGTYTCRASNSEDSVDAGAELIVLVPPQFVSKPSNVFAHTNSDVTLKCDIYGEPKPMISWMKDGQPINPSDYFQIVDEKNLKILGLMEEDNGIYQCFGSNELGYVQASSQLVILEQDVPLPTTPPQFPHRFDTGALYMDAKNQLSAPTHLRAVLVSTRFVTLSWNQPDRVGTSEIKAYSVFWREKGSERERVTNTTTTEANIQHLKPYTQYEFRVRAYNKHGPSITDAKINVKTDQEALVPTPPVNLTAVPMSPTAIHVRWDAPVDSKGKITKYVLIYYEVGSSGGEEEENIQGTGFELRNLKKYTEYSFRVVTHNENGPGASTIEIVARTFSDRPSDVPQNFTLEVSSATRIIVRWEPPPKDKQNGQITGYKIRYKKKGDRRGEPVLTDGNRNNYALTELQKGTEYQVRISALTVNGSGPATMWQFATTYRDDLDESKVPPKPARLQAKPKSNSIIVTWAPPPPNSKVLVRGYVLGFGKGIPDNEQIMLDANTHDYTIENLEPISEYVITIKAFNKIGHGPSRYETVFTSEKITSEPATPMMPPIGLKAIVLSPTTIILTWADNSLGKSQKITDSRYYTVRYTPVPSHNRRHKYVNSTDLNAHIDNLRPNTQYEFAVKVTKRNRHSPLSMSIFNTTQEAAPGSDPRDLTPVPDENNPLAVTLNWQPPARPNGLITGYLIFYSTDPKQDDRDWVVEGVVGDKLSTVINELTPSTTYYFKVQARNSKGYGPMSDIVMHKTPKAMKTEESIQKEEEALPVNMIIIIIACVVGVTFCIVIAVVTVILCRRRERLASANSRTYKSPAKPIKGGQPNMKPPDLWIHQPSALEMRKMEKSQQRSESNVSVATSTLRRGSRGSCDKLDDLPPCIDMDRRRNSFVGESGYPSSGEERYQPIQPRNIIRPKPIMIPVDGREPIAVAVPNGHMHMDNPGIPMRPVYPRTQYNTQYSSTPRVNAGDIPMKMGCLDDECVHYSDVFDDSYTSRIGYGPQSPDSSPSQYHQQYDQHQYGGHPNQPTKGIMGRPPHDHPLKSFSIPGPPGQITPVKPQQNLSPYKKPTPPISSGPIKPRTPIPLMSKAPDVTLKANKEENDLQKSLSTEELTAEMANLEGLMKDLNAITQQEFEC
ncbi:neogenin isoform X2 [Patella vulgata]|uniref:neogenin isoform X2 n=1 Tax=Patella vulgata TaxID=6465 RepID=UPI002180876C|nr:neogenin isoform X2 [Patella vulgata]